MKLLLWTFLILFFHASSFSQTVVLGTATGFSGSQIKLFTYEDQITLNPALLVAGSVDQTGDFQFNFELEKACLCYLRIKDFQAQVFISPGDTIVLDFPKPKVASSQLFSRTKWVQLNFPDADKVGINAAIIDLNERQDQLLADNRVKLIKRQPIDTIERFNQSLQASFAPIQNEFLQSTLRYSTASIQLIAKHNRKQVYDQFLNKQPILYSNPAYMEFLSQFYDRFFQSIASTNKAVTLRNAINEAQSLQRLMEILNDERFLDSPQIRELVILKELYENYHYPEYKKAAVIAMIGSVASESVYPEHRIIANNMLEKLHKLKSGSLAPDFALRDFKQGLKTLENFRGRYVYINFWALWCGQCLEDMEIIQHLNKSYDDDVYFVSINMGDDPEKVDQFLKSKKYRWSQLRESDAGTIKEDYDLNSLPAFFLVDPQGRLINPIEGPGEKLDRRIHSLTDKGPYKEKMWDWKKRY